MYDINILIGISHTRKNTRPGSATSGVGVAGRRGKRKRPPVEEDEEGEDDAFVEGNESGERAVVVEGRERYINSLLKQLIKVHVHAIVEPVHKIRHSHWPFSKQCARMT